MKSQRGEMETVSRPRDKSVEAYKLWILEIAGKLTTEQSKLQLTETEWAANWKDYWNEEHNGWRMQ